MRKKIKRGERTAVAQLLRPARFYTWEGEQRPNRIRFKPVGKDGIAVIIRGDHFLATARLARPEAQILADHLVALLSKPWGP